MRIGRATSKLTGLHSLGTIWTHDQRAMTSVRKIRGNVMRLIKKHRLHALGQVFHSFPSGGFSGIINLVESHIALHTWPELGLVTLDVYLCNYKRDNSKACKELFQEIAELFSSERKVVKYIER